MSCCVLALDDQTVWTAAENRILIWDAQVRVPISEQLTLVLQLLNLVLVFC